MIRPDFSVLAGDMINYKPALAYRLTRYYDVILRYGLREAVWKQALVRQVEPSIEQRRIFDLGCGAGTLTVMLHRARPGSEIVGIDPDAEELGIAHARTSGKSVSFARSLSTPLPCADQSSDKIVCSLFFHHPVSRRSTPHLMGLRTLSRHANGRFVEMLFRAGFLLSRTARCRTVFGSVGLFCCKRPLDVRRAPWI